MGFDLPSALRSRAGEGPALWSQYLNPQTARVVRSIGFDRRWEQGRGCYLYDDTGARYLDFLSGFGVFGVGRSHPTVRRALQEVLDAELADMVQMDTPLLAGLLAEALIERAPDLDRVYMCNSGTEAVEAALKFARCATGRPRVLYCDHAFHGLTAGSLSVNGAKEFRDGFGPLLPGTAVPFGDLGALRQQLAAGDVAALIIEPVQGKGVQVVPDGFLAEAAALLHRHGALLICDEVQTGLGRTGRLFSYEYDGVQPDLVTVAKTLSGGFVPVGATMGTSAVFQRVYSSMDRMLVHDSTYGTNALAMAAGLATLSVIDDEGLIANAAAVGAELTRSLRELAARYELISDVRGRGLLIGIEFGRPRSRRLRTRWGALTLARKGLFTQMVVGALFENHRVLTQTAGDHMDVLKLLPPLTVTSDHAAEFMTAFVAVMDSIHDSARPVWHFGWGLTTRAARRTR
ncbi:MAG TPA: aminotransferase class III-fold pyridoxal phosphate-dependent enzyme [Acidimicrobiales bacterium]|jgi:acetylornithine/succinyldiaminopimelate/putrescine aminotransferase